LSAKLVRNRGNWFQRLHLCTRWYFGSNFTWNTSVQ